MVPAAAVSADPIYALLALSQGLTRLHTFRALQPGLGGRAWTGPHAGCRNHPVATDELRLLQAAHIGMTSPATAAATAVLLVNDLVRPTDKLLLSARKAFIGAARAVSVHRALRLHGDAAASAADDLQWGNKATAKQKRNGHRGYGPISKL